MDIVCTETRSRLMSGIRNKNTKPEILIRKTLHTLGFRYRLHVKDLPGKPDIVLPKYKAVIQINGCFWHGHDCHLFKWPATRKEFWEEKITGNRDRDTKNNAALERLGWKILVIWECAVRGKHRLPLEQVASLMETWLQVGDVSLELTGMKSNSKVPLTL